MTKPRTPEAIEAAIRKKKDEIKFLEDQRKILKKQEVERIRKERTHRLCTYGGMVEGFIKKPELFTNDEVMDLLTLAFRQPVMERKLEEMLSIKNRAEVTGPDNQTELSD